MSDSQPLIAREDVHEALSHLYENDLLAQARLAALFSQIRGTDPIETRAEQMRGLLLEAIEVLRPPRRRGFGSAESRLYDVLCLRYVENMPVSRMTEELSLSRRQIHRDLLEAESRLAEVLETRLGAADGRDTSGRIDPLVSELLVLRSQPAQVELVELVQSATRLLRPLAAQLGVELATSWSREPPIFVMTDGALLKQLLVQIAGLAIRSADLGVVEVSALASSESTTLKVAFCACSRRSMAGLSDAQRIARSRQIPCEVRHAPSGRTEVELLLRSGEPRTVLIVEDNIGAVELYSRYLAGSAWRVQSVSDPRMARAAVADLRPDVIVLDIMMPDMDGWSVLEGLLASPETAATPVLICSVVGDVQLGKALGAKGYLKKPVARGELLAALDRCLESGATP